MKYTAHFLALSVCALATAALADGPMRAGSSEEETQRAKPVLATQVLEPTGGEVGAASSVRLALSVVLPMSFLADESIDEVWFSTGHGARLQLWPLDLYTGPTVERLTGPDGEFLIFSAVVLAADIKTLGYLETVSGGKTAEYTDVLRHEIADEGTTPGHPACPTCVRSGDGDAGEESRSR